MKRLIAALLSVVMVLTGCSQSQPQSAVISEESTSAKTAEGIALEDLEPQYNSLDDEQLLAHIEDLVYRDTVEAINSDEYFVENVSTVYVSKEYLEESAFNSESNIYFGYTLAELDEIFQGTRYVFTLSEDGTTTVQELQEIEDASAETILKNVAIGTGVILICVTVSVVSAGAGAPAVSMVFAASATTAQTFAVSSAAFGGISAGIVRGIQTGDFHEAMDAAALGASEGFKWGAISGAVIGGGSEAFLLKTATKSGLTMDEAALIQADSSLPIDVISQMHNIPDPLEPRRPVDDGRLIVRRVYARHRSHIDDGPPARSLPNIGDDQDGAEVFGTGQEGDRLSSHCLDENVDNTGRGREEVGNHTDHNYPRDKVREIKDGLHRTLVALRAHFVEHEGKQDRYRESPHEAVYTDQDRIAEDSVEIG